METENKRAKALVWWTALMDIDKDTYFKVYKEDNFTPATQARQLTGREIEIIWNSVFTAQTKTLLWLDDIRDPMKDDWLVFSPIPRENLKVVWVKNYQEFKEHIMDHGLPDAICFDHDLADEHYKLDDVMDSYEKSRMIYTEKTGFDCAKWLVWWCTEHKLPLPLYNIQSANPVGKQNIDSYLKNYLKHAGQ